MVEFFQKRPGVARWVAAVLVTLVVSVSGALVVSALQVLQRVNAAGVAGRGSLAVLVLVAVIVVSFIALMVFVFRVSAANARLAGERDKLRQDRAGVAVLKDCSSSAEAILKNTCGELEQRIRERSAVLEQRTVQLESEIEERQRAQDQLLQAAKMATIGEMASGMTHEMNQPMNIIRLGVEAALLKIQCGQSNLGALTETLRKVESQIIRMSEIVTHMRAYTRIDTQGQAPFDPLVAVRDGCKLFGAQLKGGTVSLDVSAQDYVSPVLGHAARLEQVVLNLLGNARESILRRIAREGGGGRISVTMREDLDRGVIIEIEDDGDGIPDDILPHIFAPFVTTKEISGTTGLGLSIGFGIVQSMKGTIEAVAMPRGARFIITLPKADETAWLFASHGTHKRGSRDIAGLDVRGGAASGRSAISTILVADDEIGAAQTLADFLQEMGYMVSIAYNGEEALDLFESDPADAVITDMKMPGMGGEELVRRLHACAPDIPIFIMTGGVRDDYKTQSLPPGVTDILYKPFSLNVVVQKLRALEVADEHSDDTRSAMNA